MAAAAPDHLRALAPSPQSGSLVTARSWLGGWLAAMGGLSVLAFALHAAGAVGVAGVVSLTSAALTLPVMVLAIAEGRRLRRAA